MKNKDFGPEPNPAAAELSRSAAEDCQGSTNQMAGEIEAAEDTKGQRERCSNPFLPASIELRRVF